MRQDIHRYLMSVADRAAARSTCPVQQVGAVLTKRGRVLMTAYNGVPANVRHCDEGSGGCRRLSNGKHAYLLHAEENLVAQAALFGVRADSALVYCTHMPCPHCLALLAQAGVVGVVYRVSVLTSEESIACEELVVQTGVSLTSLEYVSDAVGRTL